MQVPKFRYLLCAPVCALLLFCFLLLLLVLKLTSCSCISSLRLGRGDGESFPSGSRGATPLPRLPALPLAVSPGVPPAASQRSSLRRGRHRQPAGCQRQQHLRRSRPGLLQSWGGRRPPAGAAAPVSHLQREARGGAVW